jgi:hypothetical protein
VGITDGSASLLVSLSMLSFGRGHCTKPAH